MKKTRNCFYNTCIVIRILNWIRNFWLYSFFLGGNTTIRNLVSLKFMWFTLWKTLLYVIITRLSNLMACKINIYVELREWNVKSYKLCALHYSVYILNFIQERNNLISWLSTRLYRFFAKIERNAYSPRSRSKQIVKTKIEF